MLTHVQIDLQKRTTAPVDGATLNSVTRVNKFYLFEIESVVILYVQLLVHALISSRLGACILHLFFCYSF